MIKKPIVWTVAGSDSGSGAGVQADIKSHQSAWRTRLFGHYGAAAQNTIGTGRLELVAPDMLSAQLEALKADLPPSAVKLGMLGSAATLEMVAAFKTAKSPFTVCDRF